MTPTGQRLIDRRQIFLTKKVKHTYSGYALAQIKKIESHRKWLLDPPQREPQPQDFDLNLDRPISKEQLHAFLEYLYNLVRGKIEYLAEAEELYELLVGKIDYKGLLKQHPLGDEVIEYTQNLTHSSGDFIKLLQKTQRYQAAVREWKAYQSWRTHRNPQRAGMEAKSGYDLKHAMHCLRLLHSGIEILATGAVCVDRRLAGDADLLKAVLNGDFTYTQVSEMADIAFAKIDRTYQESTLPDRPNLDEINQLAIELVEFYGW
jgi:uncharacterized protein